MLCLNMQTILADQVNGHAPRSFRTPEQTIKITTCQIVVMFSLPLPSLLLKLPDNGYQDRVAV